MATFKVGQRVRIVKGGNTGAQGTILSPLQRLRLEHIRTLEVRDVDAHHVAIDGVPIPHGYVQPWAFPPDFLSPLTDPKADAFMERIKKLEPLPVREPEITA